MSQPEKSTLVKCTVCGRETAATDAHCPSCGELLVKKLNSIMLTQEDYDKLRSSAVYWKCTYCGAINPEVRTTCHNCKAVRKEAPQKTAQERATSTRKKSAKTEVVSTLSKGLNSAFSSGADIFSALPRKHQFVVIGILLAVIGVLFPWQALGLDFIGSILLLGGVGLALAGSGLLKKPKK